MMPLTLEFDNRKLVDTTRFDGSATVHLDGDRMIQIFTEGDLLKPSPASIGGDYSGESRFRVKIDSLPPELQSFIRKGLYDQKNRQHLPVGFPLTIASHSLYKNQPCLETGKRLRVFAPHPFDHIMFQVGVITGFTLTP